MSNNLAVLGVAAFAILKDELEKLPNTPRSATELLERIVKPLPIADAALERPLDKAGQLLTVKQAAKRLGVCTRTILNAIQDGRLEPMRSKRLIRISEAALLKMLTPPVLISDKQKGAQQ